MSAVWKVEQLPDLTGKVFVITGANSGIGLEAAREFARKGATVVMACRSLSKAEAARDSILAEIPDARLLLEELDLASLESVESFATRFKATNSKLDVLLNNAGIMMTPYGTTKDGFEQQVGVNHLGHFALTGHLLEVLKNTPQSRVVNISSGAHNFGKMDFDNLLYDGGKGYSPSKAYGRSKLANLLFTYELQRKFEEHSIDTIAVAAHPGASDTNLAQYLEGKLVFKLLRPLFSLLVQSAARGALPGIRAAADVDVKGSEYYGPNGFREMKGDPVLVPSNAASHNKEDARTLWEASEALTGVIYQW